MIVPILVLALLQGILEFLPVSSEGQILLVAVNLYGIDASITLSIIFWLHLGTAFAVILFYHRDIFQPLYARIRPTVEPSAVTENESKKMFGPLFVFVLIGTIGTIIVALPLYFFLKELVTYLIGNVLSALVGGLLIITGVVLYFQQSAKGDFLLKDISWKEALILGIAQGFAVLPGISRSGMTLTWLLIRGVKREEALRLSFLLGVPATFGVVAVDLLFGGQIFLTLPWILLMIVLVAFLSGLSALMALRFAAVRVPWWIFCLILGSIVLLIMLPTIFAGFVFGYP